MPHARHRISQLQTSALQQSLAKSQAVFRSKVVPPLSWFVVVTKMAYGLGEIDMRTICWRHLSTAVTTVLEQRKEVFVRIAWPDSKKKKLYMWIRKMNRCTLH